MFFRRVHWASWGLTAGSLLASSIGCMGTTGSTGGWPGLSWMRWGRPDPAAIAASDGLNPPSITSQPDYPKTEQASIAAPGAPAVTNVATAGGPAATAPDAASGGTGSRYLTGNYALGASGGEAAPPSAPAANPAAAPAGVAAAGGNQGFYDPEYRGNPAAAPMNPSVPFGPNGYASPAGNLGGGNFDPTAAAGGYDPQASPASYQDDPASAAYAASAGAYQPQPGGEPAAATGMNADPNYAPPSSDASAAYAASAGYGPPGNAYGANPYAPDPASSEEGATGYIEDDPPGAYAAQSQHQQGIAGANAYQPDPASTARSVLPGQLPNVNPQAGLTGLPQHRADPRYRPGSARDYFVFPGEGAANTANAQPGVQPAGYYGNR